MYRFSMFDREQSAAIEGYLRLMLDRADLESTAEKIRQALASYWSSG